MLKEKRDSPLKGSKCTGEERERLTQCVIISAMVRIFLIDYLCEMIGKGLTEETIYDMKFTDRGKGAAGY